jgi:Endosomal/lysosomal potassium channel TMEM175
LSVAELPLAHCYNGTAGGALEWPAAWSDGVFALAMTLLVLAIRVPQIISVHKRTALVLNCANVLIRASRLSLPVQLH